MMEIWKNCHWVQWTGTRAAWLKIPHVTIAAMIACTPAHTNTKLNKFTPPKFSSKPEVHHIDNRIWQVPNNLYNATVPDNEDDCCEDNHYGYKHHHHNVPEPNSFVLLLTALFGIIVLRCKQKRK